jgi:hypothetical protein
MKRLLLVVVLAVVLLGLLATPALAGQTAPASYPPTNVPMMLPAFFDTGLWVEYTDPTQDPNENVVFHQASNRSDPLPANSPVIAVFGWLGSVYGQVQELPHQVATFVDITGPKGFHQHFSPAQTALYWTGPTLWDEWWTLWIGGPPPELFNPKADAGVYWNHMYLPVGPFPTKGLYHFDTGQTQLLPIVDLTAWMDNLRPIHWTPEFIDWEYEFDFYVK